MTTKKVKDFHFKQFSITQQRSAMRVNTDGVLLGAWVDFMCPSRILDIGTGTGVIALMAAQRCSEGQVTAIEIHEGSYADARTNAVSSKFAERIKVLHSSLQDFMKTKVPAFDHIVSNPPYFQSGTRSSNAMKSSVRHTDTLSYGDLISCSISLLSEGGRLSVILPKVEGETFIAQALVADLQVERRCDVYINEGKLGRLLLTFRRAASSKTVVKEQMLIRSKNGEYSDEYKEITKDFYLKF